MSVSELYTANDKESAAIRVVAGTGCSDASKAVITIESIEEDKAAV